MRTKLFLVILISIPISIEIQFQCPRAQQWNTRAILYCQSNLEYVCLWNSFELDYNEACIGPIEESEACIGGYRIVQNINGNRDVEKCPLEYYQPENINFRTTQGDNCLYGKSLCSEVGQLIHSNGSSTADRTCRCDYTMGYAFISTERKNVFYCVASEEDCACYSKECDGDKMLSPDYHCITREENQTQFNRSDVHVIHKNSTTESRSINTEHITKRWNYVAAGIVTALFIMMVIICWKLEDIYIYCGKPYAIECPDDLMECLEGENCTIICVVSKGAAKWFKDDNSNITTETGVIDVNKKSYSLYTATIKNMRKENEGIYQLKADNYIICETELRFKSQFRSDLKVVSEKCLEGYTVELQCTTNGCTGTVTWQHDGVEIHEPKRIVSENQEDQHKLIINDATVADSGKYTICHGNAERNLDVNIKAQFRSDLKVVSAKRIEGYTVELQCTTNGCNGTVTWRHNGVEIHEPKRIVSENQEDQHKLIIKDATVADSGKYTICHGNTERNLHVKIKGFIKTHLVNTVIMEGLDAILKCEIEDEEEKNIASVEWLKNGSKLEGSDNIKLESEGTVYKLIIVSTELDHHNGRYEIVINQKYKSAADLVVKPLPIEIMQMPKKNREAFLSAARNGTTPNHSIRVMIVGKKEAGKTCLLRRVLEKNIDGVDSTDCLNIEVRKCQIDVQSGNWKFSDVKTDVESLQELADCGFWDFAGQKEYYASHQTFLTPNAIYILTVDMSEDLSQKTVQSMIEDEFDHIGGYINFWMDSIHCYARTNEIINLQKTNGKIYPPVIIVGTKIDKLEHDTELVNNKKREFNIHINELLDTQYKRQHIWGFHTLSNKRPSDIEQFNALRQHIYETAKAMPKWGESMPKRWILLEKALKQIADDKKVIDFESVVGLATEIKFQERDNNRELISFLEYEHHVGNVIFFDNIREFIILDHMWLVNALRCLVAPFEFQKNSIDDSDWCDLSRTGKFSEKLLKKVFEAKNPSFVSNIHYVMKIMEEYDIVLKHDNSYYVPSLITSIKFADVLRDFHVNKACKRTSWLCLEFTFLPPSFFNHILVRFTRKYKLSEIDSRPAMYQGIGVFDIKENRVEKLVLCVSKNSIAIQVWTWGTDVGCYEAIRKFLVAEVQSIHQRYRINISYVLKLKCSRGLYYKSSDKKEIVYWIRESSYKCSSSECSEIHKSDDICGKWYKLLRETGIETDDTHNTEGTRYTYVCHVCDKEPYVYWCDVCQKSMCRDCNHHHRQSRDTKDHIVQHVQDTYSLDHNFKVNVKEITDIKMLNDGLLVIADFNGHRLVTCDISGQQQHHTIPLQCGPRRLAVVDNNTVAVTICVGLVSIVHVVIVDIEQRQVIQSITVEGGCWGIMYRDNQLFVGCYDTTINVLNMSGEVTRTIPVGVVPYYICGGAGGRIYYTDNDKLYCIDTAGKTLFTVSNRDVSYPYSITTDDDDHVLVICAKSNNVLRISPDGKQSQIIINQIPLYSPDGKQSKIIIIQIQSNRSYYPSNYYDLISKSLVIGGNDYVYVYKKI